MKNLKKTLAMVLVVATMLSILVIGAGAAFTDQADVDYTEAVEVLSAIKVLEGFEDGSFKPDEILTREQAAKIIAYAMLGKAAADALATQTAPFSDVAATRWSAGYITFCANQGIINGYGDGRFGPADTLTGFQFAKMLLTALGYGMNDEFVGSNWTIEVAKFAIPLGIFDGNTAGASNAPCTREAAALYTFNAMTKTMTVNYSAILGTYYSGTNALNDFDELVKEYTLGYQVFGLEAKDYDQGGRDGHRWLANGVYITGFYGDDTVIATSTDGTELLNLVTKGMVGFKAELDDSFYIYYNGVAVGATANPAIGNKYFDINTFSLNNDSGTYPIGRGVVVELIDTDDDGNDIDVINVVEKTIRKLVADPVVADGFVTIPGVISKTAVEYVTGYQGIKTGDYVACVTIDGLTTIELCSTINGKVTSVSTVNGVTSYTINGTSYMLSELPGADGTLTPDYKNALNYRIDPTGYIAHVSSAFIMDNYGVVLEADGSSFSAISGQGAYAKAQILKSDGTVAIFDIVNPETQLPWISLATTLAEGELYAYKLDENGRIYEFTAATAVDTSDGVSSALDIINSNATINLNGTPNYMGSNTLFFYYDNSGVAPVYSVVKGHTNVSTISDVAQYSYIASYGSATAVLLKNVVGQGAADVVFISSNDFSTGNDNGTLYYTYNCFIDGKATTINLTAPITDGPNPYTVIKHPTKDIYTASVIYLNNNQIWVADSNYFTVGVSTYKITSATEVYRVYYDLDRKVYNVEKSTMMASFYGFWDVSLVGFNAVEDGLGGYNATCVFYEYNNYGLYKGIAGAPTTFTVAGSASGGLTISADLNGNPAAAATGFTPTNDKVDITVTPSSANNPVKVYVKKAGASTYTLVGTTSGDGAQTFTNIDIADAEGTAQIKLVVERAGYITFNYLAKITVTA